MKILKYPIIPITVFFASGIAVSAFLHFSLLLLCSFVITALLLLVITYRQSCKNLFQNPYFGFSTYCMAFVLGILSYSLHYAPNNPSHYSHALKTAKQPVLKGYIAERIKPNDFNEKYYFKIQSVNSEYATGKLLLTVPKDDSQAFFKAGDVILIYETPRPISKPLNPHQFDYASYMEKHNVFHQVKLKNNYIKAGQVKNFDYYIESFRDRLTTSFDKQDYSPEVMNIIKALLLGQRQDMDKQITQNYIDAGVIHILAISGLHIAVFFYILTVLFKPLNQFSKKGRLLQLLAILSFLWFFAVIAGLSASVVRAVVMFSIVSIGNYSNRNANTFNSIAVSMLALLIAKPAFLFDVGFQLSYAAVFTIVWLPLYTKIKISKYKAINYFVDVVIISLVAQLGVLPLSLYYFNQFPLLFPLANIVVIPLVTLILITAITVLALNFVYSDLALLIGIVLNRLIKGMNAFINWVASFKDFVIKDISFTLPLTLLLYTIIVFTVLWFFKNEYKRLVALLCSVLVFQCVYIATKLQQNSTDEFIVLNNFNNSVIVHKQHDTALFYTNDSLGADNYTISSYTKGIFSDSIIVQPLQNVYWYNRHKIVVIDSTGIYDTVRKPDIVLLTHSPKINLERLLQYFNPKIIIADATNYKSDVSRWKMTCRKKNIPFHATAEKGYYTVK